MSNFLWTLLLLFILAVWGLVVFVLAPILWLRERRRRKAVRAIEGGDIETLRLAISQWPRLVSQRGDTFFGSLLHYSALYARPEMAKLLLEHGADVNAVNASGQTPLHQAASVDPLHADPEQDRVATLTLLLSAGADVHAKDEFGCTPLHDVDGPTAATALLEHGADPSARAQDGTTPLHLAAHREQGDVIQLLVQSGADVNAVDDRQQPPVHYAIESALCRADGIACVELLISLGADTSQLNEQTLEQISAPARAQDVFNQETFDALKRLIQKKT